MPLQDLERMILHGLCCEWKTKCSQLKPHESRGFVQPLFAIHDLKSRWGSWSSEKREISLSADLVYNHSWGAVREVLYHEMAHQYADQVLHVSNKPPHGPGFHRACHVIRANPQASTGHRLLDQRLSDDACGPEDKILSRVRKLLALSQSDNAFEAQAAMAKAHELLRNHPLDTDRGRFISALVGKPALRHSREHYILAGLLQDFYFVYGVWVPAYALDKAGMGTVLEITGRIPNVKTACYIHDFVMRFIETRWKDYAGQRHLNNRRRADFRVGILEGFRKRLTDDAKTGKEPCGSLSLVPSKDTELDKQVAYRYPYLRRIRGRALRRDPKVLQDGIAVGRDLTIRKAIERPASREPQKLPPPDPSGGATCPPHCQGRLEPPKQA